MSAKLTKVQIMLFELLEAHQEFDDAFEIYKPMVPRTSAADVVRQGRRRASKAQTQLRKRIDYLKRMHYIEAKREGDKLLVRLTAKAKYEILRIQFALHMRKQVKRPWAKKWWLVLFDVPEIRKNYRDFLRKLLRDNGFRMWQLSVWVAPCNPEPHLSNLLRYLGIAQHYELVEVDCDRCSPRLLRKFKGL